MKKLILSAALVAVSLTSFAQVGVGTNSPEGALDVVSTDSGFLMPRMADEAAVTTPVEGMQVYNTTTDKVMLYDGTQWVEASGSTGKFVDGTIATDAVFTGGKVGIGTNTPEVTLQLGGSLGAYSKHRISIQTPNTHNASVIFGHDVDNRASIGYNSSTGVSIGNTTAGTPYWSTLSINEGRVGIGTTAHNQLLQIQGDTYANLTNPTTLEKGTIFLVNDNATTPVADGDIVNSIAFSGANSGRRRGLIGLTKLSLHANSYGIGFYTYSGSNTPTDLVTLKMLISSNGNVGIGTTTPGAKLSVVGLVEYADQTAATTAGLTAGDFYRTADGTVKVVF